MTIHLPQELAIYVQAAIQSGRFASEDDAIAEAVRLLRQAEDFQPQNGRSGGEQRRVPAWQRIVTAMQEVPDAVFDRLPADGSEQLDHYIYGTPKRPRS